MSSPRSSKRRKLEAGHPALVQRVQRSSSSPSSGTSASPFPLGPTDLLAESESASTSSSGSNSSGSDSEDSVKDAYRARLRPNSESRSDSSDESEESEESDESATTSDLSEEDLSDEDESESESDGEHSGHARPDVRSRLQAFLPRMQASNARLEDQLRRGRHVIIDDAGDDEPHISMDLGLGVFEERSAAPSDRPKRNEGMNLSVQPTDAVLAYNEDCDREEREEHVEEAEADGSVLSTLLGQESRKRARGIEEVT